MRKFKVIISLVNHKIFDTKDTAVICTEVQAVDRNFALAYALSIAEGMNNNYAFTDGSNFFPSSIEEL